MNDPCAQQTQLVAHAWLDPIRTYYRHPTVMITKSDSSSSRGDRSLPENTVPHPRAIHCSIVFASTINGTSRNHGDSNQRESQMGMSGTNKRRQLLGMCGDLHDVGIALACNGKGKSGRELSTSQTSNLKSCTTLEFSFITENVACTAKLASIFKASIKASNTEI